MTGVTAGAAKTRWNFSPRLLLATALSVAIALYFWTQSRYPSLNAKAEMGGDAPVSGIAFDTIVELLPNDGLLWEMAANTLNWMFTNWKGMTFGLLFGAAALTLIGLIQRRSFKHPVSNALLGAAIGAPLGVCVNCAAPIGRSLHAAGLKLETTLAAIVASPTLNVIVITMSFALLPFYMAATKLLVMLGFIAIGIPLIVKLFGDRVQAQAVTVLDQAERPAGSLWRNLERVRAPVGPAPVGESWLGATKWLIVSFLRNLAFIAIVSVPLMILAGALGAVLITLLPFETIRELVLDASGWPARIAILFLVAMIMILLPVPMTFDIILSVILINSGWPALVVMPVLICLGSFSIYSYLIIGRAASFRLASAMMAGLVMLGALSGIAAAGFDAQARQASARDDLMFLANTAPPVAPSNYAGRVYSADEIAAARGPVVEYESRAFDVRHDGAGQVSIATAPLGSASASSAAGKAFTRLAGETIGLDYAPYLSGLEVIEPYTMFWGVAGGDYNRDGWTDVAMAQDPARGGLILFANVNGRFARQAVDLGPAQGHFVNAVAFVDFDNDGWPDLFVSTYLHGSYVFWNREGRFGADASLRLPNEAPMIGAPGFGDLDGDGDIDILAANWSVGTTGNNNRPFLLSSRPRILWNEGGSFRGELLDGLPGESLTSLITDFNGDRRPDLMIGDDVSSSDKIYLNEGGGRFRMVRKDEGLVPYLTNTTMSFDAGDIDNDGVQELYAVQIAFQQNRQQFTPDTTFCHDSLQTTGDEAACFLSVRDRTAAYRSAHSTYSNCAGIGNDLYRAMCAGLSMVRRAGYRNDASTCDNIPAAWADLKRTCVLAAGERVADAREQMRAENYVGGVHGRNVFLKRSGMSEGFSDRTLEFGVAKPGWAWNTKFVDLDQDGWQDILVASGFMVHRSALPNTFYRNQAGRGFQSAAADAGLADDIPTSSYLLIDYDRDGDMDVIRPSMVSGPIVHRSDTPRGRALWVRIEDTIGNHAGIGARIFVRSGDQQQVREIRQSGGFVSADRPSAHFGLGSSERVDEVIIEWLDGSRTIVSGPVNPNSELVVRRRS